MQAGLPYFNPHSFRNTLVRLGQTTCQTPEHFKAWSQNLGHEQVLTTFLSYGQVEGPRQGMVIKELANVQITAQTSTDDLAAAVVQKMRDAGLVTESRAV